MRVLDSAIPSRFGLRYSTWQDWDPRAYLRTYFGSLTKDEDETLKFLVKHLAKFPVQVGRILDFGAGPTVIHAIAAAPYAREVHIADYLESNLIEIRHWLKGGRDSFDWRPFVRRLIELEGLKPSRALVEKRIRDSKGKIRRLALCDAAQVLPLFGGAGGYQVVISTYCADSATSSGEVWEAYMHNTLSLVSRSGMILLAALRRCKYYRLGRHLYPSANIDEKDIRRVLLEAGFDARSINIEVVRVPERRREGYTALVFAKAVKRG